VHTWTPFPHPGAFRHDPRSLPALWDRLHAGDAEPLPQDRRTLQAWAHFHNGEFAQAVAEGLAAGGAGLTVANKAACLYATYLERREQTRLDLFMAVVQRAAAQAEAEPGNPAAWYWQAYALGRYSQGISVAKALAQGLGSRVKTALEKTLQLQPRHADAHIALATFHAEVIDKVGPLIAGMTYGARKEAGLRLFEDGLRLNPGSAIGLIEYANGLVMLEGEARADEATRLYEQAAASTPMDAAEWLDVERARDELRD
jgi:tetratricopeptide (TPR) repeat protein